MVMHLGKKCIFYTFFVNLSMGMASEVGVPAKNLKSLSLLLLNYQLIVLEL